MAFLRGLLQTAREAAWQQPALLGVLDKLLREWDEEAFVASLPELRLAFAEMTPKETDRIAAGGGRPFTALRPSAPWCATTSREDELRCPAGALGDGRARS